MIQYYTIDKSIKTFKVKSNEKPNWLDHKLVNGFKMRSIVAMNFKAFFTHFQYVSVRGF